jgi:hypothetical protein
MVLIANEPNAYPGLDQLSVVRESDAGGEMQRLNTQKIQ